MLSTIIAGVTPGPGDEADLGNQPIYTYGQQVKEKR
jgi:hypothetical protein